MVQGCFGNIMGPFTWVEVVGALRVFPGGNQVDGLPPAPSTGAVWFGAAIHSEHGSKNLLQRAILYRHKMILLCQGRLQPQTQ